MLRFAPRQIRANCGAVPPVANLCTARERPRLPLRRELDFVAALRQQKTEGEIHKSCPKAVCAGVHKSNWCRFSAPLCKGSWRALGATEGL